jgi:hypothetical protein
MHRAASCIQMLVRTASVKRARTLLDKAYNMRFVGPETLHQRWSA